MNEIIKKVVEKLFDNVPFSKKSEELKEEVNIKFEKKYKKVKTDENELKSLGNLISKCNNLKDACKLLQCDYDDEILNSKKLCNDKKAKKNIKSMKKYYIIKSILFALIIGNIISAICYFNIYSIIFNLVLTSIYLLLYYITNKFQNKKYKMINFDEKRYNQSGKEYINSFHDKYSKKLINLVMIDISFIFYILNYLVILIIISKSKVSDIIMQISFYSTLIQFSFFLTMKNYFYKKLIDIYYGKDKKTEFRKHVRKVIKFSVIYYVIVFFIIFLLRNTAKIMNLFIIFGVIYFIICLYYNLTQRKNIVFKNININLKRIVAVSLIVLVIVGYNFMSMDLFLTQPFINNVSNQLEIKDNISYDEKTGVYTITTEKSDFKILQLTDIHLGGGVFSYSKDIKAFEACLKLIETTKPDLVVVTGDLVFPMGIMSLSLNNKAPVMQFASFMRNTGIPWAFTYGNHDTEGMATLDKNEFNELMKSLSFKTSHNLLYPYVQHDISGRSNQRIEIRHTNGNIIQELYLIDSNDYITEAKKINEYDYIHDDQVNWYKNDLLEIEDKEGYMPSSMIFFHIPLKDYKYINELYENGSSDVVYHYGILGETMIDKICTSKYDSKLFNTAVELNSTKAMFFGHDHFNNQSLEYKGIRLTYGYSIDYLAMPGIENKEEQRGGTLITINKDSSFEIKPYVLKDIK